MQKKTKKIIQKQFHPKNMLSQKNIQKTIHPKTWFTKIKLHPKIKLGCYV